MRWRAESRGLALDPRNAGPMSRHTTSSLSARGISWDAYHRLPLAVTEADFVAAHRVIAVKEAEHRPIVEAGFSAWHDRVEYWHVHDLDCTTPDEAIAHLEREVLALLERLSAAAAKSPPKPTEMAIYPDSNRC